MGSTPVSGIDSEEDNMVGIPKSVCDCDWVGGKWIVCDKHKTLQYYGIDPASGEGHTVFLHKGVPFVRRESKDPKRPGHPPRQ